MIRIHAVRSLMLVALLGLVGCGGAAAQHQHQRDILRRDAAADTLAQRADAAASVGDLTRAEQYYVAAIAAGGQEKPLVQRLLLVCVADRRYPVAAEYAGQYLRRHPRDWDISFAAAAIVAALGQQEQAQLLLERVVQKRPSWPEAHYALSSVLRERGEAPESADLHDLQYLRLKPDGPLAEAARARLTGSAP
jgi:tetratricopeptide (TPR) repeat protein